MGDEQKPATPPKPVETTSSGGAGPSHATNSDKEVACVQKPVPTFERK